MWFAMQSAATTFFSNTAQPSFLTNNVQKKNKANPIPFIAYSHSNTKYNASLHFSFRELPNQVWNGVIIFYEWN